MENISEEKIESLYSYAITKGVVLSIGISTLAILVYMIDYSYLIHWAYSITVLTVMLTIVVIFGNRYRALGNGYMTFTKAFKLSFIIFIVSYSCQLIFSILLYSVIDPDLPELLTEATITNTESLLRSVGMGQDQIDEQITRLEKEMPKQFTIFAQLKNSWMMVVLSVVFAAIAGAIIKRNEPIIK